METDSRFSICNAIPVWSKCGARFREGSASSYLSTARAADVRPRRYRLHSLMDRASRALAQRLPSETPRTYAVLAERYEVPLSTLHHRARGRRSKEQKARNQQYLTVSEEKALVDFVLRMSDFGSPVRIKFLPSLAFSIARRRSVTERAAKPPGKNWAHAFTRRHPALKSRRVGTLDWRRHGNNIHDKIVQWFELVGKVLQDPAVLPENVYNMDETGVMLSMLGSVKVLVGQDDLRHYRGANVKRTTVTAIECVSADSRSLLPMIIWPATTHRANWTTHPTPGWHYAYSESGFNDSQINLEWIKQVFDPQTRVQANRNPRVLICDGFGTHETLEIMEFCFENNVILCRLPSHTSYKLQPCDVGIFGPLKAAYRDQVERFCQGGVNTVGKQHFTYLYSPARERTLTKKNILAGWRGSGLFPFNPNRVLADMPKSLHESTNSTADSKRAESYLQHEPLRTPLTPASPGALNLLLNTIKQIPGNETSRQQKERLQEKVNNAAQLFLAKNALLEDQNRFLTNINDESKVTKSEILGKARVMSYEDLEKARADRAVKEAAKVAKKSDTVDKRKRDRRRKTFESIDLLGTEVEAAGTDEVQVEGGEIPPEPWRAPVARMW